MGHCSHGPDRMDHHRNPISGELCRALPAGERPDPYWADDVVAGIIASVRALIGVDELHARTEARYSGPVKRISPEDEE